MSIKAATTGIGLWVLGVLLMLGLMAIPAAFLLGAAVFSFWVLKWTPIAFEITVALSLLVLGPLALIPPSRGIAAIGYLIASFVFGGIMWVWGLAYTYAVWGWLGVIVGLVIAGVGIVPIAMLAALFQADWGNLFAFVVLAALTYGIRLFALWLGEKADERAARLV
jgi:hypothetical protein